MFEEERAHLQALPVTRMQYFTEVQRTVCDDSCVRIDHSSYAARPAPPRRRGSRTPSTGCCPCS